MIVSAEEWRAERNALLSALREGSIIGDFDGVLYRNETNGAV